MPISQRQSGLTLIEILIALIVLAVGLAGLSALTIQTLKNTHASVHFSMASVIALDLEERLWAALAEEARKELVPDETGSLTDGCLSATDVVGVIDDLEDDWKDQTGELRLPGLEIKQLDSEIQVSPNNPAVRWRTVPITVKWSESRLNVDGSSEEVSFSAVIPCRPLF